MGDPNLTESAWQRAANASARTYRTTEFGVAATLMTIIFGAVAAVAADGEQATTQVAILILGGAVALLLTFAIVLAVQLAAAPVQQRNELRAAWQTPEIETVNVGLTLRNLHRRGHELAQKIEARGAADGRQIEDAEAWTEETVKLLAAHVPMSLGQRFISAGKNESKTSPRHRKRVDKLEQIINEMG